MQPQVDVEPRAHVKLRACACTCVCVWRHVRTCLPPLVHRLPAAPSRLKDIVSRRSWLRVMVQCWARARMRSPCPQDFSRRHTQAPWPPIGSWGTRIGIWPNPASPKCPKGEDSVQSSQDLGIGCGGALVNYRWGGGRRGAAKRKAPSAPPFVDLLQLGGGRGRGRRGAARRPKRHTSACRWAAELVT